MEIAATFAGIKYIIAADHLKTEIRVFALIQIGKHFQYILDSKE